MKIARTLWIGVLSAALVGCLLPGCAARITRVGKATDPPIVELDLPGASITIRPVVIEFEWAEKEKEAKENEKWKPL